MLILICLFAWPARSVILCFYSFLPGRCAPKPPVPGNRHTFAISHRRA